MKNLSIIITVSGSSVDRLPHEIESYASGDLVAWVQVPVLSDSEDTILYMFYGNVGVSGLENSSGVWDSSYRAVHHLSETSGTHFDSTSNNEDGVVVGNPNQDATDD